MEKDFKFTKEQCEMLDLDFETDPIVKEELDIIEALNKKYANEITDIDTDKNAEEIEALYKKKQRVAEKMTAMYRDFDPDEISITTNETGLPDVMFY